MADAHMAGLFRLGRDAEMRYTADGTPVATLALAYAYGRKAEGEKYRPSQWIDAALWGKRAESLSEYLLKGGTIYALLDDVHIETFERREGGLGHKLRARVLDLTLGARGQDGGGSEGGSSSPARQAPPPQAKPAPRSKPAAATGTGFDDMDDDIPF